MILLFLEVQKPFRKGAKTPLGSWFRNIRCLFNLLGTVSAEKGRDFCLAEGVYTCLGPEMTVQNKGRV